MPAPETEVGIQIGGAEAARHVLQPGEYVLGSAADADLRVEAQLVSGRHARLTINYDHALIQDLGSSNGTFVNGPAGGEALVMDWGLAKVLAEHRTPNIQHPTRRCARR